MSVMIRSSLGGDNRGLDAGVLCLQIAVHEVDLLETAKALADVLRPDLAHALYRLQLSEHQVRQLVEGVQRMKYPHQVKPDQKPSIEEFEALEDLRNALLDAIE